MKVKDDNKIISDWKARQIAELFVIVIFIVKITKILILLCYYWLPLATHASLRDITDDGSSFVLPWELIKEISLSW